MPDNRDPTVPPSGPLHTVPTRNLSGDEYVVAKRVPTLDEHVMSPSGGEPARYCGPEELQLIADNNNRRVDQTGDATPIVVGHTTDGKDEEDQPEIVGFATNFTVGPLFNTGRMALFADYHVRKDKKELANQYPRRSVELWPKKWEVDPISLLGATTPERDLGLLQFARKGEVVRLNPTGEGVIHYSRRGEVIRYSRSLDPDVSPPLFPRRYATKKPHPSNVARDLSEIAAKDSYMADVDPSDETHSTAGESHGRAEVAHEEAADYADSIGRPKDSEFHREKAEFHRERKNGHWSSGSGPYKPRQYAAKKTPKCECDDSSCPCCGGKCKSNAFRIVHRLDMDDENGTPMCFGCAEDAHSTGIYREGHRFTKDVEQAAKKIPANHEPIKKSRTRGTPMAGHSRPSSYYNYALQPRPQQYAQQGQPRRYGMMDDGGPGATGSPNPIDAGGGGDAPDEATSRMVEAVLNSAPIQEIIQGSKQTQEQLGEIMQMLQSQQGGEQPPAGGDGSELPMDDQQGQPGPDDQEGGPDEQARWMHEKSAGPGTAEAEEGPPTKFMDDDENCQYEMDDDYGGQEADDEPNSSDVTANQYGAFASSTNDQIPSNTGVRKMAGNRQFSRTAGEPRKSQYDMYLESLREGDRAMQYKREQNEKQQLVKEVQELKLHNVKMSRAEQLRTLQMTEGIIMDTAQELVRTLPLNDTQFKAELEHIKVRYKRDPSGIQPFRLADSADPVVGRGTTQVPVAQTMDDHTVKKYNQALGAEMLRYKRKKPEASDEELLEAAKPVVDAQFTQRRTA